MCMKKTFKEGTDYLKKLGASIGVPFAVGSLPVTSPTPDIVFITIDVLKVVGVLVGIIYTITKTYFLVKNRGKND